MQKVKSALHADMDQFHQESGQLILGHYNTRELWELAGHVPFYAYSKTVIDQKIRHFREHIPAEIALHYAIKANPLPVVVSHIAPQVSGLDVASLKELRVALSSGMSAEHISFAGPAKSDADLRGAVATGVTLNIESFNELKRISSIASELNKRANVAIRVNPDFELKSSGMKMGGGPKQFGVDAELVPELIAGIDTSIVSLKGLHIFSGSQNLKSEAIIDAHNKTFELAERIRLASGTSFTKLNIGGGFGIPYFPGEQKLDLSEIGTNLNRLLHTYADLTRNSQLIIELGRYLVGEAGIYVCQVTDKKVSRGTTYLMCDGGLHHHLSNSGNFGQVIRKNYPVTIQKANPSLCDDEREVVTAVGPLCTPLDTLADKMDLPKATIGDFLVVFQSGAYGYTASPLNFLSHPPPVELFL